MVQQKEPREGGGGGVPYSGKERKPRDKWKALFIGFAVVVAVAVAFNVFS